MLEEQKQIDIIRELCHTVVIDRSRSTIEHYRKAAVSEQAQRATSVSFAKSPTTNTATTQAVENKSFFDIFTDLVAQRKTKDAVINTSAKQPLTSQTKKSNQDVFYYTDTVTPQYKLAVESHRENKQNTSITEHLKKDTANFLKSALSLSWLKSDPNKDQLSSGAVKPKFSQESKTPTSTSSGRITVYQDHLPVEKEIINIAPVFEQTQIATREFFEAVAANEHVDLATVHESLDQMIDSIERNPDALLWLSKLKQTDSYTYNHALNVSINLMALAQFMALPKYQVKELGMVGLMQDIGKVTINSELLNKTGPISIEERRMFQQHVTSSINLLSEIKGISPPMLYTIEQHHERFDGSGYPKGLVGKEISLQGQLAGIVDTYCAMTTDKAYAKGMFNQEALDEIHKLRDTKFNGVLIDQLVQFLGIYPVSSLVEMNSGEVGVVIEQNFVRRMLPRVMLLLAPDKSRNPHPPTIDLINAPKTPTGEIYQIIRSIPPLSYGLNPNEFYM